MDRNVEQTTTVIYIMGAARSGSTIVGIALGNYPKAFYAGELDLFARLAGAPTGDGDGLLEFWAAVNERLRERSAVASPEWHRQLEQPRSFISGDFLRSGDDYRAFNAELYRAVAEEANAEVVVDSSHYPLRRWRLGGLRSVRICTVYLVRDPIAVVGSLQTDERPKTRLAANAYVWVVHALSEVVFRTIRAEKVRVRYEDFAQHPERELGRIAELSGLETVELDYESLRVGPVFAGNRVIKERVVSLRRPTRIASQGYTTVVQAFWRALYGYRGTGAQR